MDRWTEPVAWAPGGVGSADVVGLLALAVAVMLVTLAIARVVESSFRMQRRIACPLAAREVAVEFRIWRGRRVDVLGCSAFAPPYAVRCAKSGLERLERSTERVG